jgi:hypothetical protein
MDERFTMIAPEDVRIESFLTKQFHHTAAQIEAATRPKSRAFIELT